MYSLTMTRAMQNLANEYYKMGQVDDAVKYYKKTLELSPNNASAYYELGIVYFKTGKNADAMACFQKTKELAPGSEVAASAEKYFDLLK